MQSESSLLASIPQYREEYSRKGMLWRLGEGLVERALICCEFRYDNLSRFLQLSSGLHQKSQDEHGGTLEG